jgi:hypothetical protein
MNKSGVKSLEAIVEYDGTSAVEETEIHRSKRKLMCSPTEKMGITKREN